MQVGKFSPPAHEHCLVLAHAQEAALAESRAALSRESSARRRLHNQVGLPDQAHLHAGLRRH